METNTLIPQHIGIIMDGNGRWAMEHHLPRIAGHREGAKRVKEIARAAAEYGIRVLSLFAFSTENWSRPKREVDMLMRYLDHFLTKEIRELKKNNVRFKVIGRSNPVPEYLLKKIRQAEQASCRNTGLTLVLAINYGARQEIVDAAKKICESVSTGQFQTQDLDEETFGQFLYTKGLPDLDLLIRTSGELRISNFLLWQASYAEFYFLKTYWPEFREEDLVLAIKEYQKRKRRFGNIESKE